MRAAAFFDLDRTLMAGSSAFQFGRVAARSGLISRRRLAAGAVENVRFRLRGSTDESTAALREGIARSLEGVRQRDIARLASPVLIRTLPRIYPKVLQAAYGHQDAGRPIYICTAAGEEIAQMLATVLAFDGAIGSGSEVIDGCYTGRYAGLFTYREGKAQAIRELAEREGFDLSACYAYSDSESDLPMLRAVGHPVVVNPDAELARIAREEGWQVMRFERLGRRLTIAGATVLAAAVGGAGTAARRAELNRRSRGGNQLRKKLSRR